MDQNDLKGPHTRFIRENTDLIHLDHPLFSHELASDAFASLVVACFAMEFQTALWRHCNHSIKTVDVVLLTVLVNQLLLVLELLTVHLHSQLQAKNAFVIVANLE